MVLLRSAPFAMTAILAATLLIPVVARADCPGDVASAYRRANALPPSAGRAALLEQIQRAEIAHHEGDEEECRAAVTDALDVLDGIGTTTTRSAP